MSLSNETRTEQEVVVYGSSTCPFTKQARQWLQQWNVNYRWVDVDADSEAEQRIAGWNNGRAIRPTIDVSGQILVHPEQEELRSALASKDVL